MAITIHTSAFAAAETGQILFPFDMRFDFPMNLHHFDCDSYIWFVVMIAFDDVCSLQSIRVLVVDARSRSFDDIIHVSIVCESSSLCNIRNSNPPGMRKRIHSISTNNSWQHLCLLLFCLRGLIWIRLYRWGGCTQKRAALFSSIFHLTNTNIHKSEFMLTHIPRTVTIPYPYSFRLSNTIPSIQISDFHFKSLLPSRWISFTCVQMFERIIFRNVSVIRLFFCIPFCCACMWVSGVLYTS